MEQNTPKTDRRTRRTRQALYHGLIQLLEDKPVAEISVKELCQVCDLNRSTFYLHYASVQELLEAMEQPQYYAQMGAAWAVCECFVKFPALTMPLLRRKTLPAFTQNKAIQKIRESCRVSREDKEALLACKE